LSKDFDDLMRKLNPERRKDEEIWEVRKLKDGSFQVRKRKRRPMRIIFWGRGEDYQCSTLPA